MRVTLLIGSTVFRESFPQWVGKGFLRTITAQERVPRPFLNVLAFIWAVCESSRLARTALLAPLVCLGFMGQVNSGFIEVAAAEANGALSPVLGLTPIRQIRELNMDEARAHRPVHIRGVVTFFDQEWNLLFIQDATAGIYMIPPDQTPEIAAGQILDAEGFTEQGNYAPYVNHAKVNSQGPGPMPSPKPATYADLMSGTHDSQWVEVAGLISSATTQGKRVLFDLTLDGHVVHVTVENAQAAAGLLYLESTVRLRGVCSVQGDDRMHVRGVQLFVSSLEQINIEKKGLTNDFAIPVQTIGELSSEGQPEKVVRIEGVVTNWIPGKELIVRDRTGTIAVETGQTNQLASDLLVEVVGKLVPGMTSARITNGKYRRLGLGLGTPAEQLRQMQRPSPKGIRFKVLDRIELVRRLGSEEAAQGHPLVIRGVITYYDPAGNDCFVQDETGGFWIDTTLPSGTQLDLQPGDSVEVEGYSDAGFAPSMVNPHFQILGRRPLPDVEPTSLARLLTGKEDGQWVKVTGVVRSVEQTEEKAILNLEMGNGGNLKVTIAGVSTPAQLRELVADTVQVQGVCETIVNNKRQLIGVRLLVPNTNQLQVLTQSVLDASVLPLRRIRDLMQFQSQSENEHRVRVRGTVLLVRADNSLYVHDSSDGLCVESRDAVNLKPGDAVEIVGFPSIGEFTPILQDAICIRTGSRSLPTVQSPPIESVLQGAFDNELIRIEATLLDQTTRADAFVLTMMAQDHVFDAHLPKSVGPKPLGKIRQGTLLRLTGVCSVQVDENRLPKSFRLLLRGPEDVEQSVTPMAWILPHAYRLLGVLAIVSLAAISWVLMLRSRVRHQTQVIRTSLAKEVALEQRYRDLFENATDLVFSIDLAGRWLTLNKAVERLFGLARSEIGAKSIFDFIVPSQRKRVHEMIEQLQTGERPDAQEIEVVNVLGQRYVLEVSFRPALNENSTRQLHCIARDITDRKQAEARLSRSEASLRLAQRMGQIGNWELDLATGKLEWSAETYRIFGCDPEHFHPTREAFLAFVDAEDRERVREAAERSVKTGQPYSIEHRITRPDGNGRVVWEQSDRVVDERGVPVRMIGVVQDITERKQLEDRFRQAQKMEGIGQLAGGVAHDFNNLLAVIGLNAEVLLADSGPINPEIQQGLRQIATTVERAANLTRQLLAFSRKQVMQARPLDLNEVVRQMTTMLERTIGENIEFTCTCAPELLTVQADAGMIEQVLVNLVVNARDSMPNGGKLQITTQRVMLDEKYATLNSEGREGEFANFNVRDTGSGIAPEHLPHIFEPFFTTKEPGKGTGLGLATVYGIIQQHQGWIEVTSHIGSGTTFDVFLPITNVQGEAARTKPESALRGGNETILLVEDDVGVRRITQRVLEGYGYKVFPVASGPEALGIWQRHYNEVALLLTDMIMPNGITGRDLAERFRSQRPDLKIIFFSGYATDVVGKDPRFFERTKSCFLQKPCSARVLIQTVRDCLDELARRD